MAHHDIIKFDDKHGTTKPTNRPRDQPRHNNIAPSFSFVTPETWRPKGSIVRWLNDLPGPGTREKPFEPSSVLGQKHDLDVSIEKISDADTHRDKRARRLSTASTAFAGCGSSHRPQEKTSSAHHSQQQHEDNKRGGLFARGHRVMNSISSAFSSSNSNNKNTRRYSSHNHHHHHSRTNTLNSDCTGDTAIQQQQIDNHHHHPTAKKENNVSSHSRCSSSTVGTTTVRSSVVSNSPPGTPLTVPGRHRMRFAFVGDSGCGKSSLLLRYYRDTFSEVHVPTQYELFTKTTVVDSEDVELELWDTSGDIQLHQLQLLSYLAWDAVFLCFGVDSQKQFDRTQTQWLREIRMTCRDAPVILLGLKKDLRAAGSSVWKPLYHANMGTRVGATEACLAAHAHGAVKYMECSSKAGDSSVRHVLEEGVRIVLDERAADEEARRMNMRGLDRSVVGGAAASLLSLSGAVTSRLMMKKGSRSAAGGGGGGLGKVLCFGST